MQDIIVKTFEIGTGNIGMVVKINKWLKQFYLSWTVWPPAEPPSQVFKGDNHIWTVILILHTLFEHVQFYSFLFTAKLKSMLLTFWWEK